MRLAVQGLAALGGRGSSANSVTGNEIPRQEAVENTKRKAAEFRTLPPNWLVAALLLPGCFCLLFAQRIRLDSGALRLEEKEFPIRGVVYAGPAGLGPQDPMPPCLYARDLPLIAAMGANTVQTSRLLPPGDTTFVAILDTANLYWLAGFPLDTYYDPLRSISERREEILNDFRRYAARFHGSERLIAFVLGDGVATDYSRKFAGSVSEFHALLGEAAALLKETGAEGAPLLATTARTPGELVAAPPGLSFWIWDAGSTPLTSASLAEIRRNPGPPVVAIQFAARAPGPGAEAEAAQAQAAVASAGAVATAGGGLGIVISAFSDPLGGPAGAGLFRSSATSLEGLDTLAPRAAYRALAGLWDGKAPADWLLESAPRMERLFHAATDANAVAPGALIRGEGAALSPTEYTVNGVPWPYHQAASCLCVGGKPAPLAALSPPGMLAQVPWDLAPGEHEAVFYRAGVATKPVKVEVRRYAPGIFPRAVVRAGTYCLVSAQNGVRPGEILEVYGTGVGPGSPSEVTPEAYVNGVAAEVLWSGLVAGFVGLNQVNLRVSEATPPSASTAAEIRVDGATSNLYPLSVSELSDRFGIALRAPEQEIVLQAGGPPAIVEIEAEGRNGYCGPVLLGTAEAPPGVSFQTPITHTGENARLEVRAAAGAQPQSGGSLVLYGYAPGATGGTAALTISVLPGRGDVPVRVVSGGFNSVPGARFDWNGRRLFLTTGGGSGRGINVLAVDSATGVFSAVQSFDTWGDESAAARLVQFLAGLPLGTTVLVAVADDGSLLLNADARAAIRAMFGSRFIETLGYQHAWAMIGRKGSSPIAEGASASSQILLERVLSFPMPSP
jgi:uncharacterized protein (TIGR03437 family)